MPQLEIVILPLPKPIPEVGSDISQLACLNIRHDKLLSEVTQLLFDLLLLETDDSADIL